LNTGSPHHVQLVDDLENYIIKETEPLSDMVICMEGWKQCQFVKQMTIPLFHCAPMNAVLKMKHSLAVGATAVAISECFRKNRCFFH
jgi:hypothetical protein